MLVMNMFRLTFSEEGEEFIVFSVYPSNTLLYSLNITFMHG